MMEVPFHGTDRDASLDVAHFAASNWAGSCSAHSCAANLENMSDVDLQDDIDGEAARNFLPDRAGRRDPWPESNAER